MDDGREVWRERWAQFVERCRAHPKETAETVLLVVLLLFAGLWYVSGDDETVAVQPKEFASTPQKEQRLQGARVAVKGAELAEENGELTNPFSFEHETRAQMAAAPPKKKKEEKKEAGEGERYAPMPAASVPANVPARSPNVGTTRDASAQEPVEPPLVLKGVAISEADAMAVVMEYGTRKFVHIGDEVAGMSVIAIDRDNITLEGDGGTTVLRLPNH